MDGTHSKSFASSSDSSTSSAGYSRSGARFLRALGAVSAIAYFCLVYHLPALFEKDGVLPIADFLARVEPSFFELPTIFIFSASDGVLQARGAALRIVLSAFLSASFQSPRRSTSYQSAMQ